MNRAILIQAAHYSLKFNLPWILVYTFSGIGEPPYWAIKKFSIPKKYKIKPFKLEFKLFWRDSETRVLYTVEADCSELGGTGSMYQKFFVDEKQITGVVEQ